MFDVAGIRTIDVLYRVSTRAQEAQGESLFNQRREVEEKWARPLGINVRRRIEVQESGKSALRLSGDGFKFNKRAEYAALIVEYQTMQRAQLPDAIVVDWMDRWSRNVVEYGGLIEAFRAVGIRLLAVGDRLDLTDPRNDLNAHVRAAVAQEQLRIIRDKVSEARRSRRERGKWQGGSTPDGYRTHVPECQGLIVRYRDTVDGVRHSTNVRACPCDQTKLYRDPSRTTAIAAIWNLLETSPLSWQALTDDINAAGHRRPNGKPFKWSDLYRIGENPHYAGIMVSERWQRNLHDGVITRRKALADQTLVRDSDSIVNPFVSEETFWDIHRRRYGRQTRNLPRAKNGSTSELTGILVCPSCGRLMSSLTARSSRKTGHGNPRKSPPKTYVYMWCIYAQGKTPACVNRQRIRVAALSSLLIRQIERTAVLSDEAIMTALKLRTASESVGTLRLERDRLLKVVETSNAARHALTKLFTSGALTQKEVEQELFDHRRDRTAAESRLREVEGQLRQENARPNFAEARTVITWLLESWETLTISERAEALRLLVSRVSYVPDASPYPTLVRIEQYGKAFVESAVLDETSRNIEQYRRARRLEAL